MKKKKKDEIQRAIQDLMRENVLKKTITNSLSQRLSDIRENERYFIYCEITNTNPQLSYVFNSDNEILIGRSIEQNAICIQDPAISRFHGKIVFSQGYVYIQNISNENTIVVKQHRKKYSLCPGDSMPVYQKDTIYIGCAKLRILLIQGTSCIVN